MTAGAATSTSTGVNSPGSSKSTTPVGAIVGGVLGAIALVLLLLLGILCYRRRRRRGPAVVFQTHEVRPFVVSEDQHPNPSSSTQQSSFATSTSKNAPLLQPLGTITLQMQWVSRRWRVRPLLRRPIPALIKCLVQPLL